MDPFDNVTTLPALPLHLLAFATLLLAMLSLYVYLAVTDLRAWWTTCTHDPAETDFIDIPPEWGFDVGVWCICRRCGDRTVITRARLRELDLE